MAARPKPSLSWMLVLVPVCILVRYVAPDSHPFIFVTACLAVIPLAGWLGKATEHLADKTGEGIGGLINATFGNAAELILAIVALKEGLPEVVKASLTGSVIGNVLLVMGGAFLAGGLRHRTQRFNAAGARSLASMLTLAAIALVVPAAYHYLGGRDAFRHESGLSLEISVVLLATYALGLVFSLKTHRHYFAGGRDEAAVVEGGRGKTWPVGLSLGVLCAATLGVAWISEILVGSVQQAAQAFGMTRVFVGVIVVAVIGNAAEHSTALMAAVKDRMDLAIGIAVGSSLQIALFVAPALVLLSLAVGPRPMDLVFTLPEVLAVVLSVVISSQVTSDGESNWFEGVQLLSVYAILALVFYFLPEV